MGPERRNHIRNVETPGLSSSSEEESPGVSTLVGRTISEFLCPLPLGERVDRIRRLHQPVRDG